VIADTEIDMVLKKLSGKLKIEKVYDFGATIITANRNDFLAIQKITGAQFTSP